MVNPGAFTGLCKKFLDGQAELYAAAVTDKHTADAVADIQRRYFKRFPVTLLHSQEPTEEFLAAVDDDAPEPELTAPTQGDLSDESYARAQRVYELQVAEIKMRKAQIKRRLHYQYTRSQGKKANFEMGTSDPMAILMAKLTGNTTQRPRQKTAYNLWGPANRCFVDPVFNERVREHNIPVKQHAALRSAIYKELFNELPEEEHQEWVMKSEQEHRDAISQAEDALNAGPVDTPEDLQRVLECLPKFLQSFVDSISEHTGWKISLFAGGPLPIDGGRLHMMSLHGGTTSGAVKMTFGRAERVGYRDYITPIFGKFLRKCYSVQECRKFALPEKNNFASLIDFADGLDGIEMHAFSDDGRACEIDFVKVAPPRGDTLHAASRSASGSNTSLAQQQTQTIKFGPPKRKNKERPLQVAVTPDGEHSSAKAPSDKGGETSGNVSRGPSPPVSRLTTPTPHNSDRPTSPKSLHLASESLNLDDHPAKLAAVDLDGTLSLRTQDVTPAADSSLAPSPATPIVHAPDSANTALAREGNISAHSPAAVDGAIDSSLQTSVQHSIDASANNSSGSISVRVPSSTPIVFVSVASAPPSGVAPPAVNSRPAEAVTTLSISAPLLSGSIAVPNMDQVIADVERKGAQKRKSTSTATAAHKKKVKTGNGSFNADVSDGYPKWLSNALTLLQSSQLGPQWDLLLTNWLEFERMSGFQGSGKLGAQSRPRVIGDWIQRARISSYQPEIKNIRGFSAEFSLWWQKLQPEWRASRRDGTDWDVIRQPGVNGLLSVVAGLFFWGRAVQKGAAEEKATWHTALDDVSYVIAQLCQGSQ